MTEHEELMMYVDNIQNGVISRFTRTALSQVPDSFWVIPASSSGKYHPQQSNGEGGLIRHILACLYFAKEMKSAYRLNEFDYDIVISAIVLHDIGKAMAEPHDCVATRFLAYVNSEDNTITDRVIRCVRWHMGRWATGSTDCLTFEQGSKVWPDSFTLLEQITHLCDYMASRKRVELTKLEA